MVLFVRFLLNTETRVSCSFEFVFLGFFHSQGVMIILGCGWSFWIIFEMCSNGSLAAVGWLLAGHPFTPHHMASPLTRCYYVRMLSERQFEYLPVWKYCVVFVFIRIVRPASSILWISFSCFIMHIAGAMLAHGSRFYFTLHLIFTTPAGMFLCADFVLGTIPHKKKIGIEQKGGRAKIKMATRWHGAVAPRCVFHHLYSILLLAGAILFCTEML